MSSLPPDWGLYGAAVAEAHEITGLPIALLWSVIMQESSGDIMARRVEHGFYNRYIAGKAEWTSHSYYKQPGIIAASFGLMQVMFTTAEWALKRALPAALCSGWDRRPWTLSDPHTNILIGAAVLAYKRSIYGARDGIAAYNSGSPRKVGTVLVNEAYVVAVEKRQAAIEAEMKQGE